jgi:hypothetical protein
MAVPSENQYDLPDESAALIIHNDGTYELMLPKSEDDSEVPHHVLACSAFGIILAQNPERVAALINEVFPQREGKLH